MRHGPQPRAGIDGCPLRVTRRGLVRAAGALAAALILAGHTPYAQWTVYRKRNLFIVASRTDPAAVALAASLASGLAEELPASHARHTRATDAVRIASLLATEQIDVAVVTREEAAQMLAGNGAFAAAGPVPLHMLFDLGRHILVGLPTFKPSHAYLLARALDQMRRRLPMAAAATTSPMPLPEHQGALAYRQGLDLPRDEPADHTHPD